MSDKDWARELAKIDKQLESISDDALLPAKPVPATAPPAAKAQAKVEAAAVQSKTATWGVLLRLVLAIALGVGVLDGDRGAVEGHQPLAVDVGGVQVDGRRWIGPRVALEASGHEHLEQLVDDVATLIRRERRGAGDRGLGVPAVHGRLVGGAPRPERRGFRAEPRRGRVDGRLLRLLR